MRNYDIDDVITRPARVAWIGRVTGRYIVACYFQTSIQLIMLLDGQALSLAATSNCCSIAIHTLACVQPIEKRRA